jgi:hypothetical protein
VDEEDIDSGKIHLQELVLPTGGTTDQLLIVGLVSFSKNAGQGRDQGF